VTVWAVRWPVCTVWQLICKMAPVLGDAATRLRLLESFLQLCTDSVFHVRKVSAVCVSVLRIVSLTGPMCYTGWPSNAPVQLVHWSFRCECMLCYPVPWEITVCGRDRRDIEGHCARLYLTCPA